MASPFPSRSYRRCLPPTSTMSTQLERLDDYCVESPNIIETLFPDECLPPAMWTAFFDLVDRKVYEWNSMRWMSNPLRRLGHGASVTTDEMVVFLNEIFCAIDQSLIYASSSPTDAEFNPKKSPASRSWQALTLENSADDPSLHTTEVLILSDEDFEEADVSWDTVKASCVVSPSHYSSLYFLGALTLQLYEQQINRRFQIVISISGPHLCVAVFDKGGLLISEELDIDAHPFKFFRLILGLAYASPEWLGFDTSIHASPNNGATIVVRDETFEILEVLHKEIALFGRSTLVLRCRSTKDDQEYVVKDCWMRRSKNYNTREVGLMKRAKGIAGVPTLLSAEALEVSGRDSLGKRDVSTHLDSTGFLRGVFDDEYRRKGVNVLDHHRFVMAPVGDHLSSFSSKSELIVAIADAIRAHSELLQCGILHRDISIKNILLYHRCRRSSRSERSESSLALSSGEGRSHKVVSGRRGLLIDLDKALDLTDQQEVSRAKDEILGTDLFIAHHIQDGTQVHNYKHDLESFFWVIVAISLTHCGPHNRLAEDFDPAKLRVLEDWFFGDDQEASESKELMAYDDDVFFDQVVRQMPPYFSEDKVWVDCLGKFRHIIFQHSNPTHDIAVRALLRSAQKILQRERNA